jgi:nucleotide-binding universal stress UspA family protein
MSAPSTFELEQPNLTRRVVVGIDGSEEAEKALDWAIADVLRSPAILELVTAWVFPMAPGFAFAATVDDVRLQAQRILDVGVTHVADVAPDVAVTTVLREAEPGPALVDLSKGADLLVVGSCGLGAFRELLIGSVSTYCARHAACSLVIVR